MNSVIKPLLAVGLIGALVGHALVSGVLIVKLGRFDDAQRKADEAEERAKSIRVNVEELQVEVGSLLKLKDTLKPTIADWEQRLKDKAAAEAVLATLEAKQRQAEADLTKTDTRLAAANRTLLDAEKQKGELAATIERLKSELVTLSKTSAEAKAFSRMATEAEQRLADATNTLASIESRRKLLESDTFRPALSPHPLLCPAA